MKTNKHLAVWLILLCTTIGLKAQNLPADAPIRKKHDPTTLFASSRAELYFKSNSCVYYSLDYNFNSEYRYRITNSTRLYQRLGVEGNVGGRWYLGGSISHRLAYEPQLSMATLKTNFTHRGKIGSIQFIKELSLEYIHHFNYTFFDTKKDIQTGIGAALFREIKVAKRPLGFLVSYKIIINSKLELDIYKNRNIDFTRMKLDVFYGISKKVYAGLFAMKETEYFFLGFSDAPGNNFYFRQNNIYPVLGASLNIILHPEKMEKYIPGLPFR